MLAHGTTGTGPPLVVVLGWVSSLDVVASGRDPRSSLLERLAGSCRRRCTTVRAPASPPAPSPTTASMPSVEELTEVVRAVGPPVSLLAMSAAGPIAVSLAARRPEWVSSLMLFGTFANGRPPSGPAHAGDDGRHRAHALGHGLEDLRRSLPPGLRRRGGTSPGRVFRESAPADVAADYLRSMYEHDVSGLLASVLAPTLVLHYHRDPLIPVRGSQDLAAGLPHATFLPLDGRVHLPDASDLEQLEEAIVGHVRRHAGRPDEPAWADPGRTLHAPAAARSADPGVAGEVGPRVNRPGATADARPAAGHARVGGDDVRPRPAGRSGSRRGRRSWSSRRCLRRRRSSAGARRVTVTVAPTAARSAQGWAADSTGHVGPTCDPTDDPRPVSRRRRRVTATGEERQAEGDCESCTSTHLDGTAEPGRRFPRAGGPVRRAAGPGHRSPFERGQRSFRDQIRLPQLAVPSPSFGMYCVASQTRLVPGMICPLE